MLLKYINMYEIIYNSQTEKNDGRKTLKTSSRHPASQIIYNLNVCYFLR